MGFKCNTEVPQSLFKGTLIDLFLLATCVGAVIQAVAQYLYVVAYKILTQPADKEQHLVESCLCPTLTLLLALIWFPTTVEAAKCYSVFTS